MQVSFSPFFTMKYPFDFRLSKVISLLKNELRKRHIAVNAAVKLTTSQLHKLLTSMFHTVRLHMARAQILLIATEL